jgi:hypothetical protein
MSKKLLVLVYALSTLLHADVIQKQGSIIDIALITDMSYVASTTSSDEKSMLEIPGFIHAESESEHAHEHGMINSQDGFNFNYAELGVSSTVDPYFDLFSIFHISEDAIEVEEAFFVTKKLPLGLKVGKFYSNIGRVNTQHHHYWSFTSQPLVYKALFGEHNLLEKGMALSYVLPTDNYFSFGLEMFGGENSSSFGNSEIHDEDKGIEIDAPAYPNLMVAYMKNSFDLSDRLTLLDNISVATGRSLSSELSDEVNATSHAYDLQTTIINVGMVLRYDFSSYSHLSIEAEYMHRYQDGTEYDYNGTALSSETLTKNQSGYYVMGAYKIDQNYGLALRFDTLNSNEITGQDLDENLNRYTAMIEYNPSEFSKLRLEYIYDQASYLNDSAFNNHKLILQFNHMIGTHKAHTF